MFFGVSDTISDTFDTFFGVSDTISDTFDTFSGVLDTIFDTFDTFSPNMIDLICFAWLSDNIYRLPALCSLPCKPNLFMARCIVNLFVPISPASCLTDKYSCFINNS